MTYINEVDSNHYDIYDGSNLTQCPNPISIHVRTEKLYMKAVKPILMLG